MLVNWTNEEGARFAPSMLGPGVHAGLYAPDMAEAITDRDGVSLREALEGIGYRGDVPSARHGFSAMFELHIEQGPILEAEGKEHRYRYRRPGHALVRHHPHGPRIPYRHHADEAAPQRAFSARPASLRARRCHRPNAHAPQCGGHGRHGRVCARIPATSSPARSFLTVDFQGILKQPFLEAMETAHSSGDRRRRGRNRPRKPKHRRRHRQPARGSSINRLHRGGAAWHAAGGSTRAARVLSGRRPTDAHLYTARYAPTAHDLPSRPCENGAEPQRGGETRPSPIRERRRAGPLLNAVSDYDTRFAT